MTQPVEKDTKILAGGTAARVMLGLAAWMVVISIVMLNVVPQRYSLKAGDIADKDIQATRDVVDTVTAKEERDRAMAAVPDKYRQDDAVTADVVSSLDQCYIAIDKIRKNAEGEIRKLSASEPSSAYKDDKGAIQFTSSFLEQCRTALPGSFTDDDVKYILEASDKELDPLEEKVSELVEQALKNGIKDDYLNEQMSSIYLALINPTNRFGEGAQNLGANLVSTYLKANLIYDEEATQEAKQKAADAIDPNTYTYKAGQNIVKAHDLPVTQAQIQVLRDLGLLDENKSNILIYLGIGVFSGLLMLLMWLYILFFEQDVFESFRKLLLLNIIFVVTIAATWLGTKWIHSYFLLSTAGTLLIAVLLNNRLALIINAVLALFTGILAGSDGSGVFMQSALPAAIASFAGGTIALFFVRKTPHRSSVMLAGIVSGLMSAAVFVSMDLLTANASLTNLASGLGGGLVAAMICLGTLPLWESLFKVVTPMKLLELANPNHPLLKRLLLEASGTYHHSIIVGNLAESAAEAIGANPLLTRTGAYYHDVGKLLRPYFFTENQLGDENPHEAIAPELSKRILVSHTKDGVELAAKYGLPQQVQEIILEHHGTTPVMYFYHKAVKQAGEGETVSLDDYRYAGPKPHTREAAVIMMADSIEAGARALQDHSQEKLDEFVQHIINQKLEDGQFDNCELTLRDISIIAAEFRKVLGGIFHERVVYPTMETQKKAGTQW